MVHNLFKVAQLKAWPSVLHCATLASTHLAMATVHLIGRSLSTAVAEVHRLPICAHQQQINPAQPIKQGY